MSAPLPYHRHGTMVIESIASDASVRRLIDRLARGKGAIHLSGLWGSSAPMVVALATRNLPRTFLYVTSHLEEADQAMDDLELFADRGCDLLPAWEGMPGEGAAAGEVAAERLNLCTRLMVQGKAGAADEPRIIVAPIQALMQPVPTADEIERNTLRLAAGGRISKLADSTPDGFLAWAVDRGFERLDMVESPGDVARRGDIVDLFAPGDDRPLRIEFLDDRIESIRRFDLSTQRSHETLRSASVCAAPEDHRPSLAGTTHFFTYLPEQTIVVLDSPSEIQEMGRTLHNRLGSPDELLDVTSALMLADRFSQVFMSPFPAAAVSGDDHFRFDVSSLNRFEGKAGEAVASLCEAAADHEVYVLCDNEGERQRLREMLQQEAPHVAGRIHLTIGVMHRGFEWRPTRTIVVAHHEIFHRYRQRRRLRKLHAGRPLESWMELSPGDTVVHIVHGIGLFRGLKKLRKGDSGQVEEYLTLEYADGATVHVPASQIDLVQKYIGAGGIKPTLSKLGGKRWSRTKEQVSDAIEDMAAKLLQVQATREGGVGCAYPADTEWQREFEASFLYEETEDQLLVAREIREDLMVPRPMDRLLCGDVGYGKTELAMRAAFKVVEYGRQVAVLVPTTVLAEQHYETFRERMADYPFAIGCLSRFRSQGEQTRIVSQIKKGQIDIVIGTHRLLSKDIAFANLGLVVIDEEQRFGVDHKERLKEMRETVEVLTLTATPIPRTLHMAMIGIRDISSLQTPPVDRRSIATQVRPFSAELIREAIIREMNRDGQVYFVHNRVHSIAAMAERLAAIVPEARIVYGHGQMKDHELEEVMRRFLRRKVDVLVSTTIIESGIDIPSANTIFINDADRFGLADLHQLRGRVGRSRHRAYCYLLLNPDRPVDRKAARRLKAVEEFSELGAGFHIAMRDLEIRGAGNLLGREQSGHIASVGYELYCQLLDKAVRRLKNEPDPTLEPVQLDLDVAAHIPQHYIAASRLRIEVYQRVVGCRSLEDLRQLERDLMDAFGKPPPPVDRLLEMAELRVQARPFGVRSISRQPPDVIFIVESLARVEPVFTDAPGSVRMPDPRTIHLRLPPNYLEPPTLLAVLRRMFQRARTTQEVPS